MKTLLFLFLVLLVSCGDNEELYQLKLDKVALEFDLKTKSDEVKSLNAEKEKFKKTINFFRRETNSSLVEPNKWPTPQQTFNGFPGAQINTIKSNGKVVGDYTVLNPDTKNIMFQVMHLGDVIMMTSYVPPLDIKTMETKFYSQKHDIWERVFKNIMPEWKGFYQSYLHIMMLQERANHNPIIFYNQFIMHEYKRKIFKDGTHYEFVMFSHWDPVNKKTVE